MSTRKQLARLLANDQVILPQRVLEKLDALADALADRMEADKPIGGDFIKLGMDWSTLEIGRVYRVPGDTWMGEGRSFFDDASAFMRKRGGIQVEFSSDPKNGVITVKRIR